MLLLLLNIKELLEKLNKKKDYCLKVASITNLTPNCTPANCPKYTILILPKLNKQLSQCSSKTLHLTSIGGLTFPKRRPQNDNSREWQKIRLAYEAA